MKVDACSPLDDHTEISDELLVRRPLILMTGVRPDGRGGIDWQV